MWLLQVGVAVKVHWVYSAATALHGSSCWSCCSVPSMCHYSYFQVVVATLVLLYMRPTYPIRGINLIAFQWHNQTFTNERVVVRTPLDPNRDCSRYALSGRHFNILPPAVLPLATPLVGRPWLCPWEGINNFRGG